MTRFSAVKTESDRTIFFATEHVVSVQCDKSEYSDKWVANIYTVDGRRHVICTDIDRDLVLAKCESLVEAISNASLEES